MKKDRTERDVLKMFMLFGNSLYSAQIEYFGFGNSLYSAQIEYFVIVYFCDVENLSLIHI